MLLRPLWSPCLHMPCDLLIYLKAKIHFVIMLEGYTVNVQASTLAGPTACVFLLSFKWLEEKHKFKDETVKTNLTATKAAASLTFITHKCKWWSPKWFVMFQHLPTEPVTVLDLDLPQNFTSQAFSLYLLLWKTNSMFWRLQTESTILNTYTQK